MDEILGVKVEQNKTEQETMRRVLEDGDPQPAPKQRRKKGRIRKQNNFPRELNMDYNLKFALELNKLKRESMQRKKKGQLNLNEVGVKGSASKVIQRPEPVKYTDRLTGCVCERRQTEDDYYTRSSRCRRAGA